MRHGPCHLVAFLLAGVLAASEGPADPAEFEERIHGLLGSQKWREALDDARSLHARFPDDPRVRSLLGEALWRGGMPEQAGEVLEPLLGAPDPPPRGLLTLGRLRDATGREAEAVSLMQAAVLRAPDDREILYWAAQSSPSRAETVRLLERYLARSAGDDPERVEAVRGRIAMFQALGERPIWVSEKRPDRLVLRLAGLGDPGSGATTGFVVRVGLGPKDKPVPLLLDSGSPGLFVIQRIASKRGFAELAALTTFGGGGDRRHATRRGLFTALALGELRFTDVLATTSDAETDPTGRYHGFLGLSAFQGYRVTLDLAAGRLVLEPPGEPIDGVPYFTVGGQWLVRVEVGDESGLFLFDTGATRSLVALDLAERIATASIGEPVEIHGFGGGLEGARTLRGVPLRFAGLESGDAELRVVDLAQRSRLSGTEIAGFLGLDLLAGRQVVVDTKRQLVSVTGSPGRR